MISFCSINVRDLALNETPHLNIDVNNIFTVRALKNIMTVLMTMSVMNTLPNQYHPHCIAGYLYDCFAQLIESN
jgi:hypothetical protein